MFIPKQEKQLTAGKPAASLEISGTILFKNTPIKNAAVELVVQGPNGETMLRLGKTLSGEAGQFFFKNDFPLPLRGKNIGIRVCVYSTPSASSKSFPLFFGIKNFLLLPSQCAYDLGPIHLPLAWSFCERPLFLKGKVTRPNCDESLFAGKTVQWKTPNDYVLAETLVEMDGTYHVYTYGDGRLPGFIKTILVVRDKDRIITSTEVAINPFDGVYVTDVEVKKNNT